MEGKPTTYETYGNGWFMVKKHYRKEKKRMLAKRVGIGIEKKI